jgi:DNA-binding MarR family transcriptional regulator
VIARLGRATVLGTRRIEAELARFDLALGEFDVLAALRRAGRPYELNPTELFRGLMLSSGAMTNRIDRLERAGLVERREDPDDRRATRVRLTAKGLATIDSAVTAHVANERRMLEGLSKAEVQQLDGLLRKLLDGLESK